MKFFRNKNLIQDENAIHTLSMGCCGTSVNILHMHIGISLQKKLCSMGLNNGTRVKILKNDRGHPLLLAVGDTRLAIGQGMAQKIMVHQ